MIPRDIKALRVAVPFHKLLEVAEIVEAENRQTLRLIEHITAQTSR